MCMHVYQVVNFCLEELLHIFKYQATLAAELVYKCGQELFTKFNGSFSSCIINFV